MARDGFTGEIKPEAIDWGKCGGDRTVITLEAVPGPKAAAQVADAIKYLQKEYPGAEIQVRGLDGRLTRTA